MNWEESLQRLIEGNKRFIAGQMQHPNQIIEKRLEVRRAQKPFAVVLACSDSRTPPLFIFDAGLGDLFIVRTAGNVADEVAIGSMEIAVEQFETPLIMVLGHRRCGAVRMALDNPEISGHMQSIVHLLKPAVLEGKRLPGDLWENAARANVRITVEKLKNSEPYLKNRVRQGSLKIVGGYYCLDEWHVEIITE
jgi:carbonic anhydrase